MYVELIKLVMILYENQLLENQYEMKSLVSNKTV